MIRSILSQGHKMVKQLYIWTETNASLFFFPCVFHIYIIIANQIHNSYRSEAPHRAASASLITRQAPGVQRTMFSGVNLVSQSLAFRQMSLYVRIY